MWRLPSSSMAELTVGNSRMAATRARTANGMGESETPSRCLNSSLARSRRRMTLVMSISTALVSWALVWSEATIRSAITLRSRVAGATSSRSPLASGTAPRGGGGGRPLPPRPSGGSPPGWGPALSRVGLRRGRGLLAALLQVGLDVLAAHPAPGAAALDLAQVDVVLAGQPPHQRRHPGRGLAVPL